MRRSGISDNLQGMRDCWSLTPRAQRADSKAEQEAKETSTCPTLSWCVEGRMVTVCNRPLHSGEGESETEESTSQSTSRKESH